MKTEFEQEINGYQFTLSQLHYGEHNGKWIWETADDESEAFETPCAAQGDAIRYIREQAAGERRQWEGGGRYAHEREMAHEARRGK